MKKIVRHHLDFAISYNKADEKHTLLAGGYKYLDHVTDAYIEAYGDSMEEAFSYAAKGTINVMFEINDIRGKNKFAFNVEGHDYLELLFNWLDRIILLIAIDNKVASDFELEISKLDSKYHLTGYAMTEPTDISKHGYKTEIKAITYHEMEILQESGFNKVRFILDL
ncbi:MAG TPA: archease [Nitrososphaeraceae archaeon]|nr:archease [Nitrososphaeraceae archaeon]